MTRKAIMAMLAALGLAAACSNPPTRYYTLAGNSSPKPTPALLPALSLRIPSLGVGPVKLPSLLDRNGIVLRQDAHTVTVSDTHLWGGQLEDELLAALARTLQARLPASDVRTVPWEPAQTPLYQITLEVDQFDGTPGHQATLRGTWQLQDGRTAKLLRRANFNLARPVPHNTVAGLVAVQSELVTDLAQHIITNLSTGLLQGDR